MERLAYKTLAPYMKEEKGISKRLANKMEVAVNRVVAIGEQYKA